MSPTPGPPPGPGGPPVLEDLQAKLVRLTHDLGELSRTVTAAAEAAGTTAPPAVPQPPPGKPAAAAPVRLGELAGWVQDWLLPTFRRMPGGARGRWCLRWWDHPEAVLRLSALHCSYRELLAAGGTGPGVWLRDHLDPALERLLGNEGPFATCSTDPIRHDPLEPLPSQPVPAELLTAAIGRNPSSTSSSAPDVLHQSRYTRVTPAKQREDEE